MSRILELAGLVEGAGLYGQAGLYKFGTFNPLSLNPYLLFDARQSMLSASEDSATFLESVPVLKNLSTGSNQGGNATQTTATSQPKALPLIDGDGYLYVSGVNGNYAKVNSAVLPATSDFDLRIDFIIKESKSPFAELFSQYEGSSAGRFLLNITPGLELRVFWDGATTTTGGSIILGQRHTARLTRVGTAVTLYLDDTQVASFTTSAAILQTDSEIGEASDISGRTFKGAIFSVTEGSNTNIDFTATNVPHGSTKFECETGQVVTINQSGNDPATIIKKPVLRFDGVDDFMDGVFGQTVAGGYMFAAFSVLGDGGEDSARLIGLNSTGANDTDPGGFFIARTGTTTNLISRYNGGSDTIIHSGIFDDASGDMLLESRFQNGSQISKVNNANEDEGPTTISSDLSAEEFNIASYTDGNNNTAIDFEYLALFPASITEDQATQVRDYINNRNTVFDFKDGYGYYFFDPQSLSAGAVTSWNGRIVGSDNGDADLIGTQGTAPDQPQTDGSTVTFADNTDHIDIPSTSQAGWQVVGTSLLTVAYKVDSDDITELNLLGNLGGTAYRQTGDLYGIILLPESATSAEVEQARQILIGRGAADGVNVTSLYQYWRDREDIVEFGLINPSNVTLFVSTFRDCSSLTTIDVSSWNTSNAIHFGSLFLNCSSLTTLDVSNWDTSSVTDFSSFVRNCSSLTTLDVSNWDTSSVANFFLFASGCSSLTTVIVNGGSEYPFADSPCTNYSSAFNNTNLTQQSIDDILVAIEAAGTSNGTFSQSGGAEPSATGETAVTLLRGRGWNISVTGGF